MPNNFTTHIYYDGKRVLANIVPTLKRNGMNYEVNINGFPRFWMHWGAMGRYEVVQKSGLKIPDSLALAVSDEIESVKGS